MEGSTPYAGCYLEEGVLVEHLTLLKVLNAAMYKKRYTPVAGRWVTGAAVVDSLKPGDGELGQAQLLLPMGWLVVPWLGTQSLRPGGTIGAIAVGLPVAGALVGCAEPAAPRGANGAMAAVLVDATQTEFKL